jgi:hypothetical protein
MRNSFLNDMQRLVEGCCQPKKITMRKFFPAALIIFLLPVFLLQGCLKDSCSNTYRLYFPVYKKLSEVRAEMRSSAPRAINDQGKIFTFGNYIFMNEISKGIHIIDNTNPSAPKNISFISIPGNVDLAVKGFHLFADSYSDIVVFDISDPKNVQPVKFMDNVLKENSYFWANHTSVDSVSVIVDYIVRDTIVDCETYTQWRNCRNCMMQDARGNNFSLASGAAAPASGRGGSMARFAIVNDFLYGVSLHKLYSFNIASPADPVQTNTSNLGWGIETIYPFQDKLFIGSNSGMFIYNISNPSSPNYVSQFQHATSCDPVVTDGQYAYVTLRSGSLCQGFINQMDVVDVSNLQTPSLVKTYPFTNPHGLDIDGKKIFICDGKDGLRIMDATNVNNIRQISQVKGMETYDVIAQNGLAIVMATDGLYQYDYTNINNVRLLSKISFNK